jgi:ATP-dependent helicase HepA
MADDPSQRGAPDEAAWEALERWDIGPAHEFVTQLQALQLIHLRQRNRLASLLGGRIQLLPHQLYTAIQALEHEPVRWLLADEIGLGKTIEAGLILSGLVRTGRADTVLVVAPTTLTMQWIAELYQKFNQLFVHLDDRRLVSKDLEFGETFNPFTAHRQCVVELERLVQDPLLCEYASASEPDLVVVDEAHRLASKRYAGILGKVVRSAKHAILLSGTPLSANPRGFYQLLKLLRPEHYASFELFEQALKEGRGSIPCASAVRRADVGGLPARVPRAIEIDAERDRVAHDPRASWLLEQIPDWLEKRRKLLVFVHEATKLSELIVFLKAHRPGSFAVFHPDQPSDERDLVLAEFRRDRRCMLLCSEAGGEGRNFQFCDAMIHFDLPTDPVALEQRIGRLDRIGRTKPVEIIYFHCAHTEPNLASLYKRLGLFDRPSSGIDAALAGVKNVVERAVREHASVDEEELARLVDRTHEMVHRNVIKVFYPDAYEPSRAEAVLAQIPADLEWLTEQFCIGAAEVLGMETVPRDAPRAYYFEMGELVAARTLPGAHRTQWYGTFDREEALADERFEFLSNGHELVEGLLAEWEDSGRGQAAVLELESDQYTGSGVIVVTGVTLELTLRVYGEDGERRAGWEDAVRAALPAARSIADRRLISPAGWQQSIRSLRAAIERGAPHAPTPAVAAFRFIPSRRPPAR